MGEAAPALVPELSVSDWRASRAFYCDILGFSCLYDRPEEGFAYLTRGGLHLMLDQIGQGRSFDALLTHADRPFGRGLNLQMQAPDIAPLVAALKDAGWPLLLPPEDRWYRKGGVETGNRQFIVADPDGYLLRFFQDLGERPALAG
ncbi:VOC family protein [Pseudotabrizicola sp. 4114]|uniref:bleomycin resistance protein n=1 Tax=Pseudotabrizicola sp. 4114 TaxID=2817731 RepID=UPI00285E6556|nr:catechol 2,3-dioxygenase-like lactoylglutathione lyase family enzyme [Pseudorhodobacter sp. 4114]